MNENETNEIPDALEAQMREIAREEAEDVATLEVEDAAGESWSLGSLASTFGVSRRTALQALGLIAVGYTAPKAIVRVMTGTAEAETSGAAAGSGDLTVPNQLTAGSVSTDQLSDGIAGSGNTISRVIGDVGDLVPLRTYHLGLEFSTTSTSFVSATDNTSGVFVRGDQLSDLTNLSGDYYWSFSCRTKLDDGTETVSVRLSETGNGNTSTAATNDTTFYNNTYLPPEPVPSFANTGKLDVEIKVSGSTGYVTFGPSITLWQAIA